MYKKKIENTVIAEKEVDGVLVEKNENEIDFEKNQLLLSKTLEIQGKIDAYKDEQILQIESFKESKKAYDKKIKAKEKIRRGINDAKSNPGPVADFEIMKIVNEHNSDFEVIFE